MDLFPQGATQDVLGSGPSTPAPASPVLSPGQLSDTSTEYKTAQNATYRSPPEATSARPPQAIVFTGDLEEDLAMLEVRKWAMHTGC